MFAPRPSFHATATFLAFRATVYILDAFVFPSTKGSRPWTLVSTHGSHLDVSGQISCFEAPTVQLWYHYRSLMQPRAKTSPLCSYPQHCDYTFLHIASQNASCFPPRAMQTAKSIIWPGLKAVRSRSELHASKRCAQWTKACHTLAVKMTVQKKRFD